MATLSWNPKVKLILSDVDETVADLYVAAEPDMIEQLKSILEDGIALFFITGQSLESVQWRIIDQLPMHLRRLILVGHCSGAEVWGYSPDGTLQADPFYSLYASSLSKSQQQQWRELVDQVVNEFHLTTLPTMPVPDFAAKSNGDPLTVMMEDRGPQITLEVVNGYDLTPDQAQILAVSVPNSHGHLDLRLPILEWADQLFEAANLPIVAKLGGVFAIDFVVKGVSKTTAVKHVLRSEEALASIGLDKTDLQNPAHLEIWGDKFSLIRGGTDRHMSEAVDPQVRSIDFRHENPDEFLPGYTTVQWNGERQLHRGLLEYLQSRH